VIDEVKRVRTVSAVCQDMHWEVRKEMCAVLIYISKYLGEQDAHEHILPEIKELIEDEEGEVASEAIYQFQKHITFIFDDQFCQKEDTINMMIQLCDNAAEYDYTMVDVALVFKLLTKLLLAFNAPENTQLSEKIIKMIDVARMASFDEEIRAMIPFSFRGITQMYYSRIDILIEIYQQQISTFANKEIKLGKPKPKPKQVSDDKHGYAMHYDLFNHDKDLPDRKQPRECFDDCNF
jgi:hypothetical protein